MPDLVVPAPAPGPGAWPPGGGLLLCTWGTDGVASGSITGLPALGIAELVMQVTIAVLSKVFCKPDPAAYPWAPETDISRPRQFSRSPLGAAFQTTHYTALYLEIGRGKLTFNISWKGQVSIILSIIYPFMRDGICVYISN